MNKREEAKQKSKAQIMAVSLKMFVEDGIMNTTTAAIAKEAGMSHGSIFAHFGNRDMLVEAVLEEKMFAMTKAIEEGCVNRDNIDILLNQYMDVMADNEAFFSRIYKEMPFLGDKLQIRMVALEAVMRNTLFNTIRSSVSVEDITDKQIATGLTAWIATISYYLRQDGLFASGTSVIRERKDEIIETFNRLFGRN